MYKSLNIGGQDYKLEYTIEASLCEECTEKLIYFLGNTIGAASAEDITDDMEEAQKEKIIETVIKSSISGISNLPQTALAIFYAGLLEYHGSAGDKTVRSKQDAKELVKTYFKEHEEDGTDNFYDLLMICIEQMGEDGFFKRTGIEKMISQNEKAPKKNRAQRRAEAKASGKES